MNFPGFVYLVKSEVGPFKIGRSVNPKLRLSSLVTQYPDFGPLRIIHALHTNDCQYAERYFHWVYLNQQVTGEWFNLDYYDVCYFESFGDFITMDANGLPEITAVALAEIAVE